MVLRRSSMTARRAAWMLRSVPLGSQPFQHAVGLLVGGALPGAVRVTEVDVDAEGVLDDGPAGHLAALVPGGGRTKWRGWRASAAVTAAAVLPASWPPGSATVSAWRLVRFTRVATAERLLLPMIKSPSQCPASRRSSTLAGRWAMGLESPRGLGSGIGPVGVQRRCRNRLFFSGVRAGISQPHGCCAIVTVCHLMPLAG